MCWLKHLDKKSDIHNLSFVVRGVKNTAILESKNTR